MILTGAPYILAEDANDQLSWRALGGLRILTGNDHYNAHFVLFPKIDARLRLGSAFDLRLETDAELVRHSLRAQPLESPFIDAEAFAGRYERVYDAKLTASTTIASAFSLEAFVRYADHKGAVDYFPASLSLPSGAAASTAYFMPVRFRPSYVDYKEQNVGVQLAYNHRGLFSAALRGVYAHYTTTATILSRPTFTASALVELNMVPNLSLRGGYEFATALKSYDLDGGTTDGYSAGHARSSGRSVNGSCVTLPAQSEHVITVGSLDASGVRADYSNVGTAIDIAAPGGEPVWYDQGNAPHGLDSAILTTVPAELLRDFGMLADDGTPLAPGIQSDCSEGVDLCRYYWYESGTSYAAPQVAAAAAILLARGVPPSRVGQELTALASPVQCPAENAKLPCATTSTGTNTWYGHGALRLPRG